MQFPGYWVTEDNGKVIIRTATFDETELDPDTDWKEAWQNQDPTSNPRGYIKTDQALIHAAHLLAHSTGQQISEEEILAMVNVPPLMQQGQCKLENFEHFRLLCAFLNTTRTCTLKTENPQLPGEVADEIPFD
jgi:hypothetical protein